MKVRLIPSGESAQESPVLVEGPRFVIGRAEDCDLRLPSSLVSRHHCELLLGHVEVLVRDLCSRNGTFVNKEPVTDVRLLTDGDVLGIAAHTYTVKLGASGSGINLLSRAAQAVAQALE